MFGVRSSTGNDHEAPSSCCRRAVVLQDVSLLAVSYKVPITAAILKWLGNTDKRAMIVVSKDGFIDWAWGANGSSNQGSISALARKLYRCRSFLLPLGEIHRSTLKSVSSIRRACGSATKK